ncbi:MAG: hypothetical protein ABI601_10350 [bacterium]
MSHSCPRFGLILSATIHPSATAGLRIALADDLIATLEANGLTLAANVTANERSRLEYSIAREGSQVTHTDHQLVLTWAERWTHVASVSVSDLVDLDDD